ncbi:hypothetical protein ACH4ND_26500 [Streptomyces sp. NPDC017179]|uniref:hypothetical protein n=1 Tax=Streptomyces sp. NPDC017179 TaxID=3364979 RepID=UPI00378E080A
MPQHVSTLMWIGVAVPAALTVACLIGLARIRRATRLETARQQSAPRPGLPLQRGTGPGREFVELTSEEKDAFAGMVRRLGNGR